MAHALFDLGLERGVFGVGAREAVDDDAILVVAVVELWVGQKREPEWGRGGVRKGVGGWKDSGVRIRCGDAVVLTLNAELTAVLADGLEIESVEVDGAEGQEKATRADIGGGEDGVAGELEIGRAHV